VCHQELEGVLEGVRQVPPTAEELGTAKAEALNSWVFNFASRPSQLQRVLAYQLLGVPQVRVWEEGSVVVVVVV
jgi:zinc protease